MYDREKLLTISELDKTKIKKMDDAQLGIYNTAASFFVDNFPTMQENVKTAMEAKDSVFLSKFLTDACETLRRIYADDLARECLERLKTIASDKEEDLQAFVVDFMKKTSALSIDMQMAEFKDKPEMSAGAVVATAAKNTILAVDDRHFFLTAIKTMLQDTGYKVTCINSGESALRYLQKHTPDLFILDIEMPEMDGYELAQRIKKAGHTAPIIFLTGNAKKDCVVKALQAGAADFIVKPINKEQLLERIGRYIEPDLPEETETPEDE